MMITNLSRKPAASATVTSAGTKWLKNFDITGLTVGDAYVTSCWVDVARGSAKVGASSWTTCTTSQRVVWKFNATSTSTGVGVNAAGDCSVTISKAICCTQEDWEALRKLGLDYFDGDTMPLR